MKGLGLRVGAHDVGPGADGFRLGGSCGYSSRDWERKWLLDHGVELKMSQRLMGRLVGNNGIAHKNFCKE